MNLMKTVLASILFLPSTAVRNQSRALPETVSCHKEDLVVASMPTNVM